MAGIGVQKLLTPEQLVEEVDSGRSRSTRSEDPARMVHEFPNDRAFWPMYQRCAELGLAVVSDTGTIGLGHHQGHPDEDNKIAYGQPVHFTEVLQSFPALTLVMAHFPSAFWDERLEMAREFPNLMFDISGGFQADGLAARDGQRAITETDAPRILRKIGIERFMFGTDGPTVMIQPCLEQLLRLDLTDGEKQIILADNAHRIYQTENDELEDEVNGHRTKGRARRLRVRRCQEQAVVQLMGSRRWGRRNPIHFDPVTAANHGLKAPIQTGMMSSAYVAETCVNFLERRSSERDDGGRIRQAHLCGRADQDARHRSRGHPEGDGVRLKVELRADNRKEK